MSEIMRSMWMPCLLLQWPWPIKVLLYYYYFCCHPFSQALRKEIAMKELCKWFKWGLCCWATCVAACSTGILWAPRQFSCIFAWYVELQDGCCTFQWRISREKAAALPQVAMVWDTSRDQNTLATTGETRCTVSWVCIYIVFLICDCFCPFFFII